MQSSNIKSQHAFKVLNRKKSLLQKGIIAQKEHDEALKDYQLSDSDLKSKQLEKEKCERELSEVEEQLKTANFYSPMDGTVSSLVAPETTDELNAGQLLAIISDPKNLALWIEVDETQIHRLRVGSLAKITLDSNRGQSIEGRVSEVSLGSSEKEGTRLKTYDVSTRFDPKGQNIREGFSGQAEFVFARRENTLSIPLAAIRYMDGKELVVVAHDDRSMGTPKEVKFGLKTDVEAEVVSGLMENDYVVIE